MQRTWDLNPLYSGFSSEGFKSDVSLLEKNITDLNNWTKENLISQDNALEKTEHMLKVKSELSTLLRKLYSFTNLTLSADSSNTEALKFRAKIQMYSTMLTEPTIIFEKWFSNINNLDELAHKSKLIKEHKFQLEEIKLRSKYLSDDKTEVLISKLRQTGGLAWSQLHELLTSKLIVDITLDGEEKQLTLPEVRNLASHKDQNVRKTAYEAEIKACSKIDDAIATSLSSIKGEVNTICEFRGYESPLNKVLIQSRMKKETLDAMIEAMKEYLPYFRKYLRRKGELLGNKNGIPFYDLKAPISKTSKNYTIEESKEFIIKNFKTFNEQLAKLAERAFDERWIDFLPRKGKVGGAFCANLHPIKQSRILTNYSGNFANVLTISHELGHAYHGECIFEEKILNASYPMPLAETASIFCETIVFKAAIEETSKGEAITLLEDSLQKATAIIVDILSRYIFETNVFETRKEYSIDSKELQEMMKQAQIEAYGDAIDQDYFHPYAWLSKGHYYIPSLNFYNFPYAFGLLFAKGLYAKYLENKDEFINEYNNLLASTGKMNVEDVAKLVNIDVTNKEFWISSLEIIKKDIDKFLKLTK